MKLSIWLPYLVTLSLHYSFLLLSTLSSYLEGCHLCHHLCSLVSLEWSLSFRFHSFSSHHHRPHWVSSSSASSLIFSSVWGSSTCEPLLSMFVYVWLYLCNCNCNGLVWLWVLLHLGYLPSLRSHHVKYLCSLEFWVIWSLLSFSGMGSMKIVSYSVNRQYMNS